MQPLLENPFPPNSRLVEHNGEQLALLFDIEEDEMFWVRCRMRPLTSDPAKIALLHSAQFWDSSPEIAITYRDAHTRQIAPYAHAGGGPHYLDDQCLLLIRGLYLPQAPTLLQSLCTTLIKMFNTYHRYSAPLWLFVVTFIPIMLISFELFPSTERSLHNWRYHLQLLSLAAVTEALAMSLYHLWRLTSRLRRNLRNCVRLLLSSSHRDESSLPKKIDN